MIFFPPPRFFSTSSNGGLCRRLLSAVCTGQPKYLDDLEETLRASAEALAQLSGADPTERLAAEGSTALEVPFFFEFADTPPFAHMPHPVSPICQKSILFLVFFYSPTHTPFAHMSHPVSPICPKLITLFSLFLEPPHGEFEVRCPLSIPANSHLPPIPISR